MLRSFDAGPAKFFTSDTVAVVTGGNRGIGRAVAVELACEGAQVVVVYRERETEAKATVAEIESGGGRASAYAADVSDEASVRHLFKLVRADLGGVDVLVSNAGITDDGFLTGMSAAKFDRVIGTNLRGTFLCCREAMKIMAYVRRGAIVTVSSATGTRGVAGQTNYAASKGGIVSFTKALAIEGAAHNVRANVVAPGFVTTEMTQGLTPKRRQEILEDLPLRRAAEPHEVASVVSFLASDRASYVTGAVVAVDGGLVL